MNHRIFHVRSHCCGAIARSTYLVWAVLFLVNIGNPRLSSASTNSPSHEVFIYAGHPLGFALSFVGDLCGAPVSYVDPAYCYDSSRSRPSAPGRVGLIANEQEFSFQLDRDLDASMAISNVLAQFAQVEPQVRFKVLIDTNLQMYAVLPIAWPGRSGEPNVSAFEMPLSYSNGEEKTRYQVIQDVLEMIAERSPYEDTFKRGPMVGLGPGGSDMLAPLSFSGVPAYKVLNRLMSEKRKAWRVSRGGMFASGPHSLVMLSHPRVLSEKGRRADRHILVSCPRPGNVALDVLQEQYSTPIGYEGPDLSKEGRYTAVSGHDTIVGGQLEFDYSSTQSVENVLREVFEVKKTRIAGTRFAVRKAGNSFYVSPSSVIGLSADWRQILIPSESISQRQLSVTFQDTPLADAMSTVCISLKQAYGIPIELDAEAGTPWGNTRVSYEAKDLSVGEILSACASQCEEPISWRILYHPDRSGYLLSFRPVAMKGGYMVPG